MIGKRAGWRTAFIVGGLFIVVGGPLHPHGPMVAMLADPAWLPSHGLMFVGFVLLTVGLALLRREAGLTDRTRRWVQLAFLASILQSVEALAHLVAMVDGPALASGGATPIFDTHIALALAFYSVYAAAVIGLIVAGVRGRDIGSVWFAWIGLVGAAAHGSVMWLVWVLDLGAFNILFPMIVLVAVWFVLAGFWPVRQAGSPSTRSTRLA